MNSFGYNVLFVPLLLMFLIPRSQLMAQATDSLKRSTTILPLAFYLPETSVGLGGIGITTFRLKGEPQGSRASQIIYSAAYTFKNQLLIFIPFELYKSDNRERLKGELGFYKYFYNYFGMGRESRAEDLELYDVVFPRIEANYSLQISESIPGFYLGTGFRFDYFNITEVEPSGALETDKPIGWDGGTKMNGQLMSFYDNRDNIFSTHRGVYAELIYQRSLDFLFSNFNYWKYDLDVRYFMEINSKLIWANRLLWSQASSDAPFFDLPYISSPNRSRGFDDRRFINDRLLTYQSEIRFPIYKRLRGVSFFSANALPEESESLFDAEMKFGFGAGLRYVLDPIERTSVRIDVASGASALNFYITLNEAF